MSTIYLSEEHMMYAIGKHYGGSAMNARAYFKSSHINGRRTI